MKSVSIEIRQRISATKKQNLLLKQTQKYTGQAVNGITFLSLVGQDKQGYYLWKMLCHCGKIFINNGSWIYSGRNKSCGCSHAEHCKKLGNQQRGIHNPAWIEDRTQTSTYLRKKDHQRNNMGNWQYFSRKCKENQKYICQLTNDQCIPGELVTHHIESVTIRPDLVVDVNNVIVIKKEIHEQFHKLYGKKTTRNHWEQFLSNNFIKGTA